MSPSRRSAAMRIRRLSIVLAWTMAMVAMVMPGPGPAASGATAETKSQPGPDSGETVLSREMCSGLFLLPLTWSSDDGRLHDLIAVFDTGGLNSFIDPDSLERASGTRFRTGTRVNMRNVSVAGKNFTLFKPKVRDMEHLGRALGREFDVFIPFEAFASFLLILDYPRRELRIVKGSLPEPDGVEVFSSRGPDRRPWLSVRAAGRKRKLLIDSGSNGNFSLRSHSGMRWKQQPLPLRLSHGMSELELSGVGRLAGGIDVGPLTFEEPVVALTDDTELIGSEVLQNFVLTFDQKNRRVRLQPQADGPVRLPARRGTGAVFRAGEESYEVAHVLAGSPAHRAGIQEGDEVTHIDGVRALDRPCRESRREQRGEITLTVRRGSESFDRTLPVETLIP